MTNEEWVKEEKVKSRKRLIRWSGVLTIVVGLLWFVWYLKNGSIPSLGEGLGFDETIPVKISRIWVDMFFTPVLVIVLRYYFKIQGRRIVTKTEDRVAMEGFLTVMIYFIASFVLSIAVGLVFFIPIALLSYLLAHFIFLGRKILQKLWVALGDLWDWANVNPSRHENEALRLKANTHGRLID